MRIAVLDLGSTSFHLLVVDVEPDGTMSRVLRRREILHFAAAVATEGHLNERLASKAVRAVRMLRRAADETGPRLVVAAATSALRDAANGGDLLERLSVAARCDVRLLDGHEEARLVDAGVRGAVEVRWSPALICDLGGGSLELALGDGSSLSWVASLPLGASRLTAKFVHSDPPTPDELLTVADYVRASIACAEPTDRLGPYPPCVATGGTVHALARLAAAASGRRTETMNGSVLPAAELCKWADRLSDLDRSQRLAIPGMRARRVDVLPVGALVLAVLVEQLDLGGLVVSEWGLREGLVLETLARELDGVAALAASR